MLFCSCCYFCCRRGTLHAFHFNLISAAFCFHLAPAKGHLASWQARTLGRDSRVSRMCGMCNNLNYAHETWLAALRGSACHAPLRCKHTHTHWHSTTHAHLRPSTIYPNTQFSYILKHIGFRHRESEIRNQDNEGVQCHLEIRV